MEAHFNSLTPEEHERLSILAEEMGEALQAAGKILRHGYESYDPMHSGPSNRLALMLELGDVLFAIRFMCDSGDLNAHEVELQVARKRKSIGRWLHHAPLEAAS